VTLFEVGDRLGGHADTHLVVPPSGPPIGVDTGFIVYNERAYPLLTRMFAELGVATRPAEMSMSVRGARRNIGRHYDRSNDLFALFLDETMTYSSAIFGTGPDGAPVASDLAEAQRRKIDRLLDRAGVGPGCRVLEIGTGWGELALRAARRGATVLTVTISREQQALAARQVAEAGLAGRVRVVLRDYRDIDGEFDAIPVLFRSRLPGRLHRRQPAHPGPPMTSLRPAGKPASKPDAAAEVIAGLLARIGLDLRVRAWDGSEAGPAGPPVLVIRSPRALRRMAASRPQYSDYIARTSGFLPLPPRRP
jgi:Mycolic acid cyclopropane synthetase